LVVGKIQPLLNLIMPLCNQIVSFLLLCKSLKYFWAFRSFLYTYLFCLTKSLSCVYIVWKIGLLLTYVHLSKLTRLALHFCGLVSKSIPHSWGIRCYTISIALVIHKLDSWNTSLIHYQWKSFSFEDEGTVAMLWDNGLWQKNS